LASHVAVDSNGHFQARVGSYSGVVFAKLVNKGSAADYLDEATNTTKDLSASLMAVGVIPAPGTTLNLNINVLSTLAVNQLAGDYSAAHVTAVNAAVAHAFGLSQLHGVKVVTTNSGSYNAADGLSSGEQQGAVLAALSGMDLLNGGSMQTTLDQLMAGFSLSGGGSLNGALQYQVAAGAKTLGQMAANRNDLNTGALFADVVAGLIHYVADPATEAQALTAIAAAALLRPPCSITPTPTSRA